jgi:G:T-mismatch repair DNA endonuclease (very short patch repair protein)
MLFLMKLTPSHCYRYRRDFWWLKLNRNKEKQNARVKALIIANCCGLSSLVKPDTGRRALCGCVKKDLWLIKQSKSVESDIEKLGATNSTGDGTTAEKKER